jgi:subtilisin family serine protease
MPYPHLTKTELVFIEEYQVLDKTGRGEVNDLIKALDWSIKKEVDIVNISFGFQVHNKRLKEKIREVIQSNIIIVAASGNSYGLKGDYPAIYEEVLSIGSINKEMKRSNFSSKGNIDFVLPGEDILSTNNIGGYSSFSGTSFAAAHATGMIALILSEDKTFKLTDEITFNLEQWDKQSYGKGLLTLRKEEIINEF